MYGIIKKPIITEKNTILNAAGVYTFEVDRKATKDEIKSAVEKLFEVKVQKVRTMQCRNRARRVGAKISGVRYWKKALVQVAPGEKIGIFEGV